MLLLSWNIKKKIYKYSFTLESAIIWDRAGEKSFHHSQRKPIFQQQNTKIQLCYKLLSFFIIFFIFFLSSFIIKLFYKYTYNWNVLLKSFFFSVCLLSLFHTFYAIFMLGRTYRHNNVYVDVMVPQRFTKILFFRIPPHTNSTWCVCIKLRKIRHHRLVRARQMGVACNINPTQTFTCFSNFLFLFTFWHFHTLYIDSVKQVCRKHSIRTDVFSKIVFLKEKKIEKIYWKNILPSDFFGFFSFFRS